MGKYDEIGFLINTTGKSSVRLSLPADTITRKSSITVFTIQS
ncbi:MAG TPA: hypothetical protein PL110_18910 [Candidatus Eremiobacteraeota bacterium]|nr:MAG: hypothetical protein BWY64_03107 [bacterium ADurb.Bin363]HPZ10169.1 hypothetical protein [Candidatus Eremiobacteraeota bacterium]